MIVNASIRTDLPACYPDWFMQRIREGYVNVVDNPRFPDRVLQRSLRPADVDCIVFWTKNPKPLLRHLDELDERGFKYYWHYTITGYPRELERNVPSVERSIETLQELSARGGANKIIWRYDPILFTSLTPLAFHEEMYERLAGEFSGKIRRNMVSLIKTVRPQVLRRLAELSSQKGIAVRSLDSCYDDISQLMTFIKRCAADKGIELQSCREAMDLTQFGIPEGKCVDADLIHELFGIALPPDKHSKREGGCRCYWGCDIGMESTCLNGCVYCYATQSQQHLANNIRSHDVDSPSLHGWHEISPAKQQSPCAGCGECSFSTPGPQVPLTSAATRILPRSLAQMQELYEDHSDLTLDITDPYDWADVTGGVDHDY